MNWANQEILNYDYFIDLFLIRDLNDNDSFQLMNSILNKYKVDINKFKMWLYYGGEGNYKNLKDIFEKLSKYFLEKEDNISDLFFLFWDNPNKFLFLFILLLLQKKESKKFYDLLRRKLFLYSIFFYYKKGKFDELFIKENEIKNEINSYFKNILRNIYTNKEEIINEFEKNQILYEYFFNFKSLIDNNEINNNEKKFDFFKYIKQTLDNINFKTINVKEENPISLFKPIDNLKRDQLKEEYKEILKFSSLYQKIKKKLFLWNNTYSNEEIFVNNNNENVKELKFKLSNHLTKEMTLPLLVPIINIVIYLPFFSKFSKEKMFKSSFEKIHKINLYPYNSFFDDKTHLFCFDNYKFKEINNLEFNVCFVKPIYHDKGFLEINEKEKEIYFFSLPYYLLDNEDNFDKERECCYGCLFNSKKKESKILKYKCINLYNINFYLERYYLCENSSIEIFTKDNKSYFFQFENERKKKFYL